MPSRDYQEPDAVYTPIPDLDIDPTKPIHSFLLGELRDGVYHCLDVCYDRDRHQPVLAHDHDGRNSAHLVSSPSVPNLISAGIVTPLSAVDVGGFIGSSDSFAAWKLKNTVINGEGIVLSNAGQWAVHTLVDRDRPKASLSVFGGRCDLVVSCFVKASAELADGLISFGLIDADDDDFDDDDDGSAGNVDFPKGMRVYVPATVIGTTWKRVWAVLDNVGSNWARSSVRFAIKCDNTTAGGHVVANYPDVRPGRSLDYYTNGYHTDLYEKWKLFGYSGGPPPLDEKISITDALLLGAT